jgi:hypothetical protein
MTKKQLQERIEKYHLDDNQKNEWKEIKMGKKEGFVKFLTTLENPLD